MNKITPKKRNLIKFALRFLKANLDEVDGDVYETLSETLGGELVYEDVEKFIEETEKLI